MRSRISYKIVKVYNILYDLKHMQYASDIHRLYIICGAYIRVRNTCRGKYDCR